MCALKNDKIYSLKFDANWWQHLVAYVRKVEHNCTTASLPL